tara:strand:+ start:1172 stop:2143 length:972 start_codon:yes stop_codon:yes gene_type:complete
VVDKTPLKFEFDSTTPSSLAEFTSSDTMPVVNGGTGVSSLALLGASLSGIDLSSTWVSATNITATNVSATSVSSTYIYAEKGVSSISVSSTDLIGRNITAEVNVRSRDISGTYLVAGNSVSSTSVSANYLIAGIAVSSTSVSANYLISSKQTSSTTASSTYLIAESGVSSASVSATALTGANAMPIPAPFAYIQLTADDAASSDEKHVGYSNTPTSVVSDTDDITWDDTAKNFVVKKVGTYECVGRLFFEGGSTLIELHVNVEGSPVNTANPRAHTTVDPVERTISAIFTCAVDDVVDITYEATSAQTTAAQIGTTVTIKRLK